MIPREDPRPRGTEQNPKLRAAPRTADRLPPSQWAYPREFCGSASPHPHSSPSDQEPNLSRSCSNRDHERRASCGDGGLPPPNPRACRRG